MSCDELREEYGAYALGIAEEPQHSEIAEHLGRHCPNCTPGVRRAMEAVAAIGSAVKITDPPKRLRRRVIALVAAPARRSWAVRIPWAIAVVLAIALLSVALPRRRERDTSKLEQALSILNDPATKDVSFGEPSARGRVFVSPDKGLIFIAAHLPKLDAHQTFQLWLLPANGKPVSAGTFKGEPDATAVYVRRGPVENAAAVAVTVEPEGGSLQPTTTPFAVTKL
ncbi:MAG TPA: anti-sigma factor [Bryobacteraceae bacterium]|nr:anti-sigma factor [Bryobacteraceae bacterium]